VASRRIRTIACSTIHGKCFPRLKMIDLRSLTPFLPGSCTNISAYDTDFTIATNVAVGYSANFWFRIQTPTNTSSYNEHSSTVTVIA